MIEHTCHRSQSALPVVCKDFGMLVPRSQASGEARAVTIDEHVDVMLKSLLKALSKEDLKPLLGDVKEGSDQDTARKCLGTYVREYEQDPVQRRKLSRILDLNLDDNFQDALAIGDLKYYERLSFACGYIMQLFEYSSIYFLIDPSFDVSSDMAWSVLEPLLSAERLPQLPRDQVAFIVFLDTEFWQRAQKLPLLNPRPSVQLEWPEQELAALLKTRLTNSNTKRSYRGTLAELAEMDDLDRRVLEKAESSPQKLIHICHTLFNIHYRPPIKRLISEDEWSETLGVLEMLDTDIARLINQGEGQRLEFKSTLRYDLRENEVNKALEKVIAKALCGLMNADGGVLIIGVDDSGQAIGLDYDLQVLHKKTEDGFERALTDVAVNYLELPYRQYLSPSFEDYQRKRICVIRVEKSKHPVFCLFGGRHELYVRVGNLTKSLDAKETLDYVANRFPQ
jgi:hypothetical protein